MIINRLYRGAMLFGGTGTIADTVDAVGVAVQRRVVLFDRYTMTPVRTTWSSAVDGSYSFTALDTTVDFVVMAIDHTNVYNCVVKDRVRAA